MKKNKNMILAMIGVLLIVLGIIVSILMRPSIATDKLDGFSDITVDGLRFTNANLSNNKLTALVQNTKATTYSLKSITVTFKDEESNVIATINSYIGDTINANEIRVLYVKTDVDLSYATKAEYKIVK